MSGTVSTLNNVLTICFLNEGLQETHSSCMQFPSLTCTWVITYNCFHVSSCLLPEEDRDSVKDSSCLANFWLHSESWLNAKNNSFAFPSPSPSGCLSSMRYSPSMKWSRLSMVPRVGWRGWEPWSSITTYFSELRKSGSLKVNTV